MGPNCKVKGEQTQALFDWTWQVLMIMFCIGAIKLQFKVQLHFAKWRNSDSPYSEKAILPYVLASLLPGKEFGRMERLGFFGICPLIFS